VKRFLPCLILAACDGSSDGVPDGGVDAGPDINACGLPLEMSGNLDIDIPAVRVTGRITLDGAAPPQASYGRPRIELRGADGSTGVLVDLERVPTGQYDVMVLPGTYDVLYSEPASSCTGTPYPCAQRAVLRSAVEIKAAGVLDLDIRTVHVTGRVTLDGATPPASDAHPAIELAGADKSTGVLVDLDRVPSGNYDVRVLAGTYDVLYAAGSSTCTGMPYPCQRAPLEAALALQSDGRLDLDVKTVAVSGRITLDGAAPPAATFMPRIELRGTTGATGLLVDLDNVPTGQYQTRVVAGTYDVMYERPSSACAAYPCQSDVVLRAGVALNASGVLDVDIKTIGVSGRVTLDGAAPPTAAYEPVLELRGADKSSGTLVDLELGATYQARVIAGQYDVLYSEPSSSCTGTPWPCQQKRVIKPGVALQATGVLDIDVKTIAVSGAITLDKAAAPAATSVKISLRGDDASTGTLVARVAPTYQTRILAGTYDLLYTNSESSCPGMPWPCQQNQILRTDVSIATAGALDIDIPTIALSGRVTLAGAMPPAASYTRPRITLRGEGGSSGTLVDLERVTTGMYQTRLVPSRYIVLYNQAGTCTGTPYPCQTARALYGCGSEP
jgi:hypothetical protein